LKLFFLLLINTFTCTSTFRKSTCWNWNTHFNQNLLASYLKIFARSCTFEIHFRSS
jgi:hypothetical protein